MKPSSLLMASCHVSSTSSSPLRTASSPVGIAGTATTDALTVAAASVGAMSVGASTSAFPGSPIIEHPTVTPTTNTKAPAIHAERLIRINPSIHQLHKPLPVQDVTLNPIASYPHNQPNWRAAPKLLPPELRVGAGLSGGGDSSQYLMSAPLSRPGAAGHRSTSQYTAATIPITTTNPISIGTGLNLRSTA